MREELAVFKACSDETRLRILFLLAVRELCVCEIVVVLGMPQGKISRHLSVLKHAGLVSDRREGLWIYYSLAEAGTELKRQLRAYLQRTGGLHPDVLEDRERLDRLVCEGEICATRPASTWAADPKATPAEALGG